MQCALLPGSWCIAGSTAFPGIHALFSMKLGLVALNLEGYRVPPLQGSTALCSRKRKGNLHCRDVRHMRGANSLGDQEPKVSLSPSDLEANFIFFDENKQPPLPSIWLWSAGPVHCDSVRTDIVASPLPLLGHHALAHPRGVRVHATGSCRNTISVATCITIKQDVR